MSRSRLRDPQTLALLLSLVLLISILSPFSLATATVSSSLVTCVNLDSGIERIGRTGTCRRAQEAVAYWRKNQNDSTSKSGKDAKFITICSNKESSAVTYQIIRPKCARHQVSTTYSRIGALPSKPVISSINSDNYESASLILASDPATNLDAPIAFYTVTSNKGDSQKFYSWRDLKFLISGLQAKTTYTFKVTATSADGTSMESSFSSQVTTPARLAAPAFTLSSSFETRSVNSSAVGFTTTSTGGAIAGFAINATPPGMSFNTLTGALIGTPTTVASATSYTITATNASGSASQTFVLTVTAPVYSVGNAGPAGGTIFYVSNAGFACGPTLTSTCHYLELAPLFMRTLVWSRGSFASILVPSPGADKSQIGTGYWNTLSIIAQNGTYNTSSNAYEAGAARSYSGGGVSDWYMPSKDELQAIYDYNASKASPFTWNSGYFYNSSTEISATQLWGIYFAPGTQIVSSVGKTDNNFFFAIRAF